MIDPNEKKNIQAKVKLIDLAYMRDYIKSMTGETPAIINGSESAADIIRSYIWLTLPAIKGRNYRNQMPSEESIHALRSKRSSRLSPERAAELQQQNLIPGDTTQPEINMIFPQEEEEKSTETPFNVNITNKMKQCDLDRMNYFIEQFNKSISQSNPINRVTVSDYLAMKDREDQKSQERYAKILACLWLSRNHDSPEKSELEKFWETDQENDTLIARESNPLFKDIKGNVKAAHKNQSWRDFVSK